MPNRNQVGATMIPMVADVALTMGTAVVMTAGTEDHVTTPAAANDQNFFGYAVNDCQAGEVVSIHVSGGIAYARASAAITLGKYVQIADATGAVVTATPAAGSNSFVTGKALRAALAAGDLIPVIPLNTVMQG